MEKKFFFFFIINIILFNYSSQLSESENLKLENLPIEENDSFHIIITYKNGKYYIPNSPKDAIKINIDLKNENINNYYYRYFYTNKNNNNLISENIEFSAVPNKTITIPEAEYIIAEMLDKKNKNKIYLKSEMINYYNTSTNNGNPINANDNKFEIISFTLDYIFKDNCFSLIIFFSTFCFTATASAFLTIIDLKEDKNLISVYNLNTKERADIEFKQLKNTYITKNIFSFSWFLMKYMYPISNIFTIYNYDHPRYIRLFIVVIKIILNFLISILCFSLINKVEPEKDLQNIFSSFSYSILASVLIYILTELITKKYMGYDNIRRDIWKPKLESLRKYIFYTVKKDILFNSKWHFIRNRIISYTRICGNYLLRDKPSDKYKIYVDNKNRNHIPGFLSESESVNNDYLSKSGEELLSEKYISTTFNIKTKNSNNNLLKNTRRKNTFFAKTSEKGQNYFLNVERGVQSFSISKYGQNNLKLKTVQRIEDIKNRYILNINESKYEETIDINNSVKTYENLEIETLENYTYISTDSMNKQLVNRNSESNKIFLNLLVTLIVLLILTIADFGLISVQKLIKDDNDDDLERFYLTCFLPVAFQIVIFNFIFNYIFSFIASVCLFKFYGYEKTNCFYKLMFKIFVEKYIKYIYRIRLLMNKYNKELDFIDK